MIFYYVIDGGVIYVPIHMHKAVSEAGHVCQAIGKGRVDQVCLAQAPEAVSVVFGNCFKFPGGNMEANIQGRLYGRQEAGSCNVLAVLVSKKPGFALGPELVQPLQGSVNIFNFITDSVMIQSQQQKPPGCGVSGSVQYQGSGLQFVP